MNKRRVKMILAGGTIAVAITLLGIAGIQEGWMYYLPVDQFVISEEHHMNRVRLHGLVSEDGFESSSSQLSAQFILEGETQSIQVSYSGIIPDMFQPGCEVVIEGELGDEDVFYADTLMTKCASKYETDEGFAPHADPNSLPTDQESAG
jgi:cytochrome c-type biogenesis protein CcmE